MNLRPRDLVRPAVGLLLAALAFLPLSNWIAHGESPHIFDGNFDEWWSGSLIVVGIGVILALLSRRREGMWRLHAWRELATHADLTAPRRAAVFAVAAGIVYAVLARMVHGGRPLLIDEIVEVWQARILASGHLWVPSTGHPELFGVQNVVDDGTKVFGQFPVGGPAMLALGSLIRAEWLVGPVFAALGVWWWSVTLRRTGEATDVAFNAMLLLAFAPFVMFMAASHMNHVTALTWTLGGIAGLATVVHSDLPHPRAALGMGLAFGLAASIRPVDAAAFGAPAGLWLFLRALQDRRRIGECALAAVGMALPIGVTFAVNAASTGHPLEFGYNELWGPGHGLGFHAVPWGNRHTPLRGLELINIYLLHLQVRFLETPFPSLVPALAVLIFGRGWKPFDRYLLGCSAAILGLYWAYWHNGFFLGPRFVYFLVPVLALLTARFGTLVRERFGEDELPSRVWVYSVGAATLLALGLNIPLRARTYARSFLSARFPAGRIAEAAGATNALVLVRESWGAQAVTRLWGLGVPRTQSEFVYQHTDMCVLEHALTHLESDGTRDVAATTALMALTGDSARVVDSVLSTDKSERLLPGSTYDAPCVTKLREDYRGFTVYPPLILDDRSGNVYIHDQHARDTIALARYPDRPIYVLIPDDSTLGALPKFHRATKDSLLKAWGLVPGGAP